MSDADSICAPEEKLPERKRRQKSPLQLLKQAYHNMIARCYNPRNDSYSRYGAMGIRVCERWLESFDNFYADMGDKPTPKHSIDRYPNNAGNYEPGNCRWATWIEQAANKRRKPRPPKPDKKPRPPKPDRPAKTRLPSIKHEEAEEVVIILKEESTAFFSHWKDR